MLLRYSEYSAAAREMFRRTMNLKLERYKGVLYMHELLATIACVQGATSIVVVHEHSRVSPSSRTMLLIYAAHIYLCMYTVRVRYTRSRSLASTAPESRIEGTGSCREVCSTYVIHERTNERLGRRPSALVAETR
jgi:hypothetical protein